MITEVAAQACGIPISSCSSTSEVKWLKDHSRVMGTVPPAQIKDNWRENQRKPTEAPAAQSR